MATVAARIASRSERSGDHVLWRGAVDGRGVGLIKVDRRTATVRRVAWGLQNGPLPPGARVLRRCDQPACIAADHLFLAGEEAPPTAPAPSSRGGPRPPRSSGSLRERSPGVWELAVVHGVDDDGRPRRAMRTFRGPAVEASEALAAFVVELGKDGRPERSARPSEPTVDDLVQEYWQYAESQGRAHSTLVAYRDVYKHWVRPPLGDLRADRVGQRDLDRPFGAMRTAGQSHSRMNQAKVVLSKAGKSRTLAIDSVTVKMLNDLFEQQDADAASVGLTIQPDGYVFGLLGSHREPMRPEYMTRKMREVRAALTLPTGSFDATILALRKFTTTELLDAGLNPSMEHRDGNWQQSTAVSDRSTFSGRQVG